MKILKVIDISHSIVYIETDGGVSMYKRVSENVWEKYKDPEWQKVKDPSLLEKSFTDRL